MGRKHKSGQLTPLELEIMKVLWDTGAANVQTVQEKLAGQTRLAYTTVQTMQRAPPQGQSETDAQEPGVRVRAGLEP